MGEALHEVYLVEVWAYSMETTSEEQDTMTVAIQNEAKDIGHFISLDTDYAVFCLRGIPFWTSIGGDGRASISLAIETYKPYAGKLASVIDQIRVGNGFRSLRNFRVTSHSREEFRIAAPWDLLNFLEILSSNGCEI